MAIAVDKKKADLIANKVALDTFKHITAYGDTKEDHAMLNLADKCFYQGKLLTPE